MKRRILSPNVNKIFLLKNMKMSSRSPLAAIAIAALATAASTMAASNLVPNGDFESGLAGFTSDYLLVDGSPSSLVPESTYFVGTDPFLYHPLFSSYGDHTTGSGHMLIANGAADTTKAVWETAATIPVIPGTLYYFEAWMSSAHPASPAVLSFKVDGDASDDILGTGMAPATTGVWDPISHTWFSGANTSVTLLLLNANPEHSGNDFAVDDIYFGEETSIGVPDAGASLGLAGLAFGACVFAGRRFRNAGK